MKRYIRCAVLPINKLAVQDRVELALSPTTSARDLVTLSKDRSSDVRAAVADNLNTPPDILEKLSKANSMNVLEGVADNINTPTDALTILYNRLEREYFESYHAYVIRLALARHPNTSKDILEKLAIIYGEVGNAAKAHLAVLDTEEDV